MIGDNTDGGAFNSCKTGKNILGKRGLDFKKIALVHRFSDHLMHIVWFIWIVGYHTIKRHFIVVMLVEYLSCRWFFPVIERHKIDQSPGLFDRFKIVIIRIICNTRFYGMSSGTAKFFLRHHLIGYCLYYVGTSHKHIAAIPYHKYKICHGR